MWVNIIANYSHKFANIWSFLVLFGAFLALFGSFHPKLKPIKKPSKDLSLLGFLLWGLTGSNRRPSACKADALNQLS